MIYIAIVLFIIPILLKTIQSNEFTIKVLLPTLTTYSIWFLISFFLILINININYYLYFFTPFPIALFLYEIVITYLKRKSLFVNKYFIYILIFLIINFIISIFTYKYLQADNTIYMKWAMDAFKSDKFIGSNAYKYNSFYYIATIFGYYNIPVFFNTLSTYIFGLIMYIFIILIIKLQFPKTLIWPIQLVLMIIVSAYNNTSATNLNWSIGVMMAIASVYNIMIIMRNKYKWLDIFLIDVITLFLLNFTLTGFAVGIFIILIVKIIVIVREKNLTHSGFFIFFLFYLYNYRYNQVLEKIYIYLFLLSLIFSIILICISCYSKITYKNNVIYNLFKNIFLTYDSRKYRLYKFIFLNLFLISFSVVLASYDVSYLHKDIFNTMATIMITIVSINIIFIYKFYELFLVLLALYITFIVYTLIVNVSNSNIIASYLSNRVIYAESTMLGIFIIIMLSNVIVNHNNTNMKYLKNSIISLLGVASLFTIINPNANLLQIRFSAKYWNNNISHNNYKLAEKYYSLIYNSKTFSIIDLPFVRLEPQGIKYLYYNGVLASNAGDIHIPFFEWENWGKNIATKTLNEMYINVEKTTTYKIVILNKGSVLDNIYTNNKKQYKLLDSNEEINIWKLK